MKFENIVLRSLLRAVVRNITGVWRKLHNKLHNLYSPTCIIIIIPIVIKSRSIMWAGHRDVWHAGGGEKRYSILIA
jgi:hypothetical protein